MELNNLISRCRENDILAQKELYNRYKNILYNLSLKYCNSVTDAEDNLQDSFIEIFKHIKKFKKTGSFEGWIKKITINKAIDKYKKNIKKIEIPYTLFDESHFEIDNTFDLSLDYILELIQNLPSQYRIVFNLYHLEGYSHREIALLLNISESTSKSNYHRARLNLKEKIENKIKINKLA